MPDSNSPNAGIGLHIVVLTSPERKGEDLYRYWTGRPKLTSSDSYDARARAIAYIAGWLRLDAVRLRLGVESVKRFLPIPEQRFRRCRFQVVIHSLT